jgi:hypothetical protein
MGAEAISPPRVAVVYNNRRRASLIETAKMMNLIYSFKGADGQKHWLKRETAYLEANGAATVLRRLGAIPCVVSEDVLYARDYDFVIRPDDCRYQLWFETVGAAIQGHSRPDVDPVFGLDQIALKVKQALGVDDKYPWRCRPNVLVLRHDTDSSDDTTYAEYEYRNGIAATYAILPDKNFEKWRRNLAGVPGMELSYHYNSVRSGILSRALKPSQRDITGTGIDAQVNVAKKMGLECGTIHKHGNAFYYPETVDAMDFAYKKHPLLGMGSMSRWHMIGYGGDSDYTVRQPGVGASLWFPYHLWLATTEEWRPLRGWDMPMLIEPDPVMVDRVFENAKKLPGGVYMLGYHPAHARDDVFVRDGCFPWFEYTVRRAQDEGWLIASYCDVLVRLNEWESGNMDRSSPVTF